MPGTAPYAVAVSSNAATAVSASRVIEIAFIVFLALIAALLLARIPERIAATDAAADMDFGHHATEVFGVVGKVVELGCVEIEHAPRRIERCRAARGSAPRIAGIQNHVQRLAAAQRN